MTNEELEIKVCDILDTNGTDREGAIIQLVIFIQSQSKAAYQSGYNDGLSHHKDD